MNILVTHISYHASVGIIKLLRKISSFPIYVVGTSSLPKGMSCGSLMVDRFYQTPSSEYSSENYLSTILSIIKSEKIDFVFSPDEEEALLFHQHKYALDGKIILPQPSIIDLFRRKQEASLAMEQLGISIPTILSSQQLNSFCTPQEVIIRENISCCSYGIHITNTAEIDDINKHLSPTSFLQSYISGEEYTVDVFCDKNGEPQVIIPRNRIAIRNGITYKCRIEKQQKLIETCKTIYKHYFIPGISNVQFIIDSNGTPYFIELNPRIGGTTIASSLASLNLIELNILHFKNNVPLQGLNHYMSLVKWGSVVARYYEETIYLG